MSNMQLAFKVAIKLGDGAVIENKIAANNVFGAVKFIQDEATANGWFVSDLLVESFSDADVAKMVS